MVHKKDIINFFKKAGMISLFTLSLTGCQDEDQEVVIESKVQSEQSSDLKNIVAEKNRSNNNAIYFAFNAKKDTRPESLAVIKDAAQFLKDNPAAYLILTGHVDAVAANQMINYTVALDRAYKTKEQLVAQNIDSSRIYIKATTKQTGNMTPAQERRVMFEYAATTPKVGLCNGKPSSQKQEKKQSYLDKVEANASGALKKKAKIVQSAAKKGVNAAKKDLKNSLEKSDDQDLV